MPQLHPAAQAAPPHDRFTDHLTQRARNRLHAEPPPTRIIEVGEIAAGIAVPEPGGVRFFSSARVFDDLDGTVFRSTEQAARAARERFRARTTRTSAGFGRGGGRLAAV